MIVKIEENSIAFNFSASTIIVTLLASCILIGILDLLLTKKKGYRTFRTDFLFVFVLATILRLCLPFEYFFTFSVYSSIFNPIRKFLNFKFGNYPITYWLCAVWIVGALIQLIRYLQKIKAVNSVYNLIVRNSEKKVVGDYIPETKYQNIPIYISSDIQVPMVMGFHKAILLPNLSLTEEERINILNHELKHIENKDIYLKCFINLLIILYWWFPPVYLLQKEVNLFLEIRVDDSVTRAMNEKENLAYAETLFSVQKKVSDVSQFQQKELSCLLLDGDANILTYRIQYLFAGTFKKRTNGFLLALAFLIPFLSNSIVFETYYPTPPNDTGNLISDEELSNSYIIEHTDGTYTWYLSKDEQTKIIDPSSLIEEGVPIRKEER